MGEAVERHLSGDEAFINWVQDPDRVTTEKGDRLEMRETVADELETVESALLDYHEKRRGYFKKAQASVNAQLRHTLPSKNTPA